MLALGSLLVNVERRTIIYHLHSIALVPPRNDTAARVHALGVSIPCACSASKQSSVAAKRLAVPGTGTGQCTHGSKASGCFALNAGSDVMGTVMVLLGHMAGGRPRRKPFFFGASLVWCGVM